MARFPSLEWCQEAVRLAEADPEAGEAGSGWTLDVAVVFLAEPGLLPKGFAIYLRPDGDRMAEVRVIENLSEVDTLGAAYVAKAAYAVWKGLLQGSVDPVEAVLRKQVSFAGDLRPLVARAGHKGWIERTFAQVPTEFIDE